VSWDDGSGLLPRLPRTHSQMVRRHANPLTGKAGPVAMIGAYPPIVCPVESETLPLQATEPSAESRP
jgi:hypothetical protein